MDCGEFYAPHSRKERVLYDRLWRKRSQHLIKAAALRYYKKNRPAILKRQKVRREA